MAHVSNAFDMLRSAEATLNSKKKKKQAKKPEQVEATDSATSQAAAVTTANGHNGAANRGPIEVYEAIASFESRARQSQAATQLWNDWISQANERTSRTQKYKSADNTLVDFRTVLLQSKAIEISLENAFEAGLSQAQEELLAHLLLTFFGWLEAADAKHLSSALIRLSGLVQNETYDVKGAALRAVSSIVGYLKASASEPTAADVQANAYVQQLNSLSNGIAREQANLQKLTATAKGAITKQHVDSARNLLRLTGDQLDLLQSDAAVSAVSGGQAAVANSLAQLNELKQTITSKIKVNGNDNAGKGGKGAKANAGANSQAAALASLRKEESMRAGEADALATQIRGLEAQLRSLRAQLQDVEAKRSQVQQRMRSAGDNSAAGAKKATHNASQYQDEIAVVATLCSLLETSSVAGQGMTAAQQAFEAASILPEAVAAEYVVAVRQYLEYARASLADVPARVNFCKQRQAQAEKLQRLGAKGDQGQKVKDEADKLMSETIKSADDLLRHSTQVAGEFHTRYEAIHRALPDQDNGIAESLRAVETLMTEIRSSHDSVQALLRPPAVAQAAVPASVPVVTKNTSTANVPVVAAPVIHPAAGVATIPTAQPVAVQADSRPATAAAPPPQQPQANAASKSAFDMAAEFLANARMPEVPAPKKPTAPAPVVKPTASIPTSTKQWGKPATAPMQAPGELGVVDEGLPTPAEAFKSVQQQADVDEDGFKVSRKKSGNRPPKV